MASLNIKFKWPIILNQTGVFLEYYFMTFFFSWKCFSLILGIISWINILFLVSFWWWQVFGSGSGLPGRLLRQGTRRFPYIGQTQGQLLPHSLITMTNSNIWPHQGAFVISTLVFSRLLKNLEPCCLEIVTLENEGKDGKTCFSWLINLGLAIPYPRVE